MRAAEKVDDFDPAYCCYALEQAAETMEEFDCVMDSFQQLFKPKNALSHSDEPWWPEYWDYETDHEFIAPRVLALLLCAEMARTGDL